MHSGEKSNKCNQCDYSSSRAGHLRRHLKMHSGEKDYLSKKDAVQSVPYTYNWVCIPICGIFRMSCCFMPFVWFWHCDSVWCMMLAFSLSDLWCFVIVLISLSCDIFLIISQNTLCYYCAHRDTMMLTWMEMNMLTSSVDARAISEIWNYPLLTDWPIDKLTDL